ncbi:splicing factor 3B subunit 4-like [Corticium candelabrum]|uniref:splicing factor 3B subunit 4-like n=1 Tax=Corticium candelabrum TaxID=121492 RepID=UPI002E2604E4|nr:splicing factor 3B subunit 4-like [Corticium candelabrum]
MRDPDTGNSKGFAFVNFASFEASDNAIEAMNSQYLCNRPISVSYAFKKEAKGERHGSAAERLLAAQNPLSKASLPHQLFADAPVASSGRRDATPITVPLPPMMPPVMPPVMRQGLPPMPPVPAPPPQPLPSSAVATEPRPPMQFPAGIPFPPGIRPPPGYSMPNRPPLGMPGLAPQLQTGVANLAGLRPPLMPMFRPEGLQPSMRQS